MKNRVLENSCYPCSHNEPWTEGVRETTHGHLCRVFHVVSFRIAVCSDRRHQWVRQPFEIAYEVALLARLGALRDPAVLLDGLPLLRDEIEHRRTILDCARLNKPAADDDARGANTATAMHLPRRVFSPSTSRIWRMYDWERGRHRSGIGKEWYSTSPSSMLPMREACAARRCAYGESSPLSVRSMNVRTPARSNIASFCERCARVGVHGYSHATSSGVA